MTRHSGGAVLRTIRSVGAQALTDRELLARFATGDQRAFEVLVKRHTPLVLGVCRRALSTTQDAEDATQAVFLILARKAQAHWHSSVANWLFTTARRVASRANRSTSRRAQREVRTVPAGPPSVLDQMTGREMLATLDEELGRLPAIYREPLVLCHLEGLTRDEAAARLGVPVATLKSQLDRGRKRLADALTRRGMAIGAGLLAVAVDSQAGACPPRMVESVLAALAGAPPAGVRELIKGVAMNAVLTRMKLLAVAAVGLAAMGFGLASTPRADEQGKSTRAKADKPAAANPNNDREEGTKQKQQTIAGRVLGADGKPIIASLAMNWLEGKVESLGDTKADGTFRVTLPLKGRRGWILATAPGHGTEFVSVGVWDNEPTGEKTEVTIRLPKDQPIRGRIVDTQGKPRTGVRVTVESLTSYDNNSMDRHLKLWTGEYFLHGRPPSGDRYMWLRGTNPNERDGESPPVATTDAEGWFKLTGVGAEQMIGLRIRGTGTVNTDISVMNRAGFDPKPYYAAGDETIGLGPGRPGRYPHLYGPEPRVVVESEKVIRGTVTARDTGKPLGGVPVFARTNEQRGNVPTCEAITDNEGRYEIRGLRKNIVYFVGGHPDVGTGYFSNTITVDDTAGYGPITANLDCARGVIVSGTVRDKATGKPVSARLRGKPTTDNPFAKDYQVSNHPAGTATDVAGRFRFVTIPGPVVIELGPHRVGGPIYRRLPPGPDAPKNGPGVAEINWRKTIETQKTDREVTITIELEQATRTKVKVVDSEGKPVMGTHATGVLFADYAGPTHFPDTDTISAYDVAPDEKRLLSVVHAKRRFVGSLTLRADDKAPVVKLGPGGKLTGRVLDADGKPVGDVTVIVYYGLRSVGEASEPLNADGAEVLRTGRRVTLTDANGEFRFDALFPGQEFRLTFIKAKKRLGPEYANAARYTIEKHGDAIDLGDMKLKPPDE